MRSDSGQAGAPLIVLMFHGLVERHPPYATFSETRTCQLRVSDFAKTLESCARQYRFVRLADIRRYLDGEATEPGVLLTFDDGMSSVCELAAPILLRHGATATLFVTTNWIDEGVTPPIFELEPELWSRAPVRLGVQVRDFIFEAEVPSRQMAGKVIARLWSELFSHRCAPVPLKKEHFFFDGQPWSVSSAPIDTKLWHPASWDALRSAVRNGALEIGAHGATHSPWPWLNGNVLDDELASAKTRLEAEFDAPVETCAYPHGLSDESARSLAGARFHLAFGTAPGPTIPGTDRTNLPRYHVPSEGPNGLSSIVSWPLLGRILRRGARSLGL